MVRDAGEVRSMAAHTITYGLLINLALERPATVSSQWNANFGAHHLTDGVTAGPSYRWAAAAADTAPSFIIALDGPQALNRVVMYEWRSGAGYRAEGFTIEVSPSASGNDWERVYEGTVIGLMGSSVFDTPVTAHRVRVTLTNWLGTNPGGQQPSLHEVKMFYWTATYFGRLDRLLDEVLSPEDFWTLGWDPDSSAGRAYFAAIEAGHTVRSNDDATQVQVNNAVRAIEHALYLLRSGQEPEPLGLVDMLRYLAGHVVPSPGGTIGIEDAVTLAQYTAAQP